MKKYYYDCPIQALYMMREFDVKFFTKGFLNIESDFLEMELGYHLTIRDIYGKLANDYTKIYVAPESEYIFEPKEGDIGICGKLLIPVKFDIKDWVPSKMLKKETYYEIKETLFVKTVYRNGKHFFMPKEEN